MIRSSIATVTKIRCLFSLALALSSGLLLAPLSPISGQQPNEKYTLSNAGIENIQASKPITGAAMDPATNLCIKSVEFKGNSESMLTVDPRNPNHLVGASHFIYNIITGGTFSGSVGVHYSNDAGLTWENRIISGFDCVTFQNGTSPQVIKRSYDPVVAFDDSGNLYAAMLPSYGSGGEYGPIYVAKSTDGGATWKVMNKGKPLFLGGPNEGDGDKQWIIVDNNRSSQFYGTVYVVWVAFFGYADSEILLSKSVDKGETFTPPIRVSPPHNFNGYAWPIPGVASDGTLYVNFIHYENCKTCDTLDEVLAKSTDGGNSFTQLPVVTNVTFHGYTGTTFRAGIYQSFAVNPTNGNLLMAVEIWKSTGNTDVLLFESVDGGNTWRKPVLVNDNENEPTNQFQPVVAVSPSGLVAVAFYDRRLNCPATPSVLLQNVDKKNWCIDTSVQFYTDKGSLSPIGENIRVTKSTWDPTNGGSLARGNSPTYIGDYFGLALTDTMAFPFFTTNFNLGDNPAYDLQVFVARVKTPINLAATTSTLASLTSSAPQTSELRETTRMTTPLGGASPFEQNGPLIAAIVGLVIVAIIVSTVMRRGSRQRASSPQPVASTR